EVADALSLRDSLNQQIISQRRYIESLQITLLRANKLYSGGMSSYIEVLDAERSLFTAQQKLLDLKYAQQVNEVNLFSALGGGWSQ
ncbi:TolC family protein, partial [Plesiomonas shigelloides]|uniref:TolC family protein n=1 Tax=Plesiomonas shigelloides TaxID=703 RepID=UPI0015A70E7C